MTEAQTQVATNDATLGTMENPLESSEPAKLAEAYVMSRGVAEGVGLGLVEWRGNFWRWTEGVWKEVDRERVWDDLMDWMEDAYVGQNRQNKKTGEWETTVVRLAPTPFKVGEVLRCLQGKVRVDGEECMPKWLASDHEERLNPKGVVAFRNVVVDVETGIQRERGPEWFDSAVLPVDYDETATCPRWDRCLEEWSGGDRNWKELLRRIMGYALMGHRRFERWVLMYGKIRGGKGTIAKVMRMLMGQGYLEMSLEDLAGGFGLDGLQKARLLCISEVSKLEGWDAQKAARIIKNLVGRDPLTINVKMQRQLRNVECPALVMLHSNQIPNMPDDAKGLSGKMLMLPFNRSFLGREQMDLIEELRGELGGIAMWAFRGAVDLERAKVEEKWPVPEEAGERVKQFTRETNPFESFLQDCFVVSAEGYVRSSVVKEMWVEWVREQKLRVPLRKDQLNHKLIQEGGWNLGLARRGSENHRVLCGLSLRSHSSRMQDED